MAKPITKGFSLVETLIASALLAMLSLTLIKTTLSLNNVNKKSEQSIQAIWQRRNFIAHRELELVDQYFDPIETQTTTLSYVDMDDDGIADTWHDTSQNNSPSSTLITKVVTKVSYPNGAIDYIVSASNE